MTHRAIFKTSQGVTIPKLRVALYDDDDEPMAMLVGDTATFILWPANGGDTVVNGEEADIISLGTDGVEPAILEYEWLDADVAEAGTYLGQFIVAWATGGTTRFPQPDPIKVEIASVRQVAVS
jgi:hypothetical protein